MLTLRSMYRLISSMNILFNTQELHLKQCQKHLEGDMNMTKHLTDIFVILHNKCHDYLDNRPTINHYKSSRTFLNCAAKLCMMQSMASDFYPQQQQTHLSPGSYYYINGGDNDALKRHNKCKQCVMMSNDTCVTRGRCRRK